jgi:DNA-binding FadR family transcriptional regulator
MTLPVKQSGRAATNVKESRTDGAVRSLREWIFTHGLGSGDLLPSEAELCAELKVGRNSLREAVRTLRATGVLEVRQGAGTYVGVLSLKSMSDELIFHSRLNVEDQGTYLRYLSEVRESLEQGLLTNLVTEGLKPDLEALERILAKMDEEAKSGFVTSATDREFHEELLAPLKNPLSLLLLEVFWRIFDELLDTRYDPAAASKTADRHHAILLAIKASDPRGARIALHSHFDGLRNRIGSRDFKID